MLKDEKQRRPALAASLNLAVQAREMSADAVGSNYGVRRNWQLGQNFCQWGAKPVSLFHSQCVLICYHHILYVVVAVKEACTAVSQSCCAELLHSITREQLFPGSDWCQWDPYKVLKTPTFTSYSHDSSHRLLPTWVIILVLYESSQRPINKSLFCYYYRYGVQSYKCEIPPPCVN